MLFCLVVDEEMNTFNCVLHLVWFRDITWWSLRLACLEWITVNVHFSTILCALCEVADEIPYIYIHTNCFILFISEAPLSGAPSENTLPITIETQEDPTLNNLTRTDANCDKTGTCYDGKHLLSSSSYETLISGLLLSPSSLLYLKLRYFCIYNAKPPKFVSSGIP